MRPVWVVQAAAVTALGDGLEGLWRGLLAGRSAIAPVDRFDTTSYSSKVGACVPGLSADGGRTLLLPLLDRLLHGFGKPPADSVLVTATTKGGIDCLERTLRGRPAAEAAFLIPELLKEIVRKQGLCGRAVNISAACASSTIAVARGSGMIASGSADSVLVLSMDLLTEFVFSGFSSLQALSAPACRPFDRHRSGLSLGEGAAALLLMSPERARREGKRPLGEVAGWGVANDAVHVTAPARDGSGLILAVRAALHRAGVKPGDIAAASAHGTGTVYNDLMELTAFGSIFGHKTPPIYGIKGAIGHTLGAAGGIEVALGLRCLAEGTIPPTVGLTEPDPAAGDMVAPAARKFRGDFLLATNSGFGGINAAILLRGGTA